MYSSSLPCPPPSPNISHKRQPYYSALAFCLLFVVCCLLFAACCLFYFYVFLFLSPGEVENAIEYAWQTLPLPQQRRGGEEAGGARGFSRLLSVHFASLPGGVRRGGMGLPGQQQTFFHLSDIKESNILSGDDALPRTVGGERGGEDRCSVIRS